MFSYEAGLVSAILIWLWHAVTIVISVNSRMERNLNRIGQRISWLTLTVKPIDSDEKAGLTIGKILKFVFIVGINLPFVLLSWIYVTYIAVVVLYRWRKNAGEPQARKEFRWKMKNLDLTFDQIVREMMKMNDDPPENFEKFRDRILQEMANNT